MSAAAPDLSEARPRPRYIHATAVLIADTGVLLRGPSRAGKSSVALALLAEAARQGRFARLIGDDRVAITLENGLPVMRGHPLIQGKIEARGQGILTVEWQASAVLHYVFDLVPPGGGQPAPALPELAPGGIVIPSTVLAPAVSAADRASALLALIDAAEAMRRGPSHGTMPLF